MAYGDIIEYEGKKYRDITPNITSNTTPAPYYANASKEYIYNAQTGRGHAYCVFCDPPKGIAVLDWCWSPGNPPNWIGIGMGQPVQADLIKISTNRKIQSIILYGSNGGGSTLETIRSFTSDTRTGVPEGQLGTCFVSLPGRKEYSYYRLHTTSVNPSGWSGFFAIHFYQAIDPEKYLLSDNGLKTIKDNTLTTLDATEPTKALFNQEGFTSLSSIAAIADQLSSQFDLLRYSPDSANTAITITHLPADQLITAVDAVDLSAYATVKRITLQTTGTKGIVKNILKKVTGGDFLENFFRRCVARYRANARSSCSPGNPARCAGSHYAGAMG